MEDAAACSAIDALVDPLVSKLEGLAGASGVGATSLPNLKYEVTRAILLEMIRRLVLERASQRPGYSPSG